MKTFKVTFNIPAYISIEVEANDEESAKLLASEELKVEEFGSRTGYSTVLALKGEDNKMFLDADNCYERIDEVEEV